MKKMFKRFFSYKKSEQGFTLIELAIVMVIIGIILGAVLKGQDLIDSARAKKFVNDVKKWEVMTWTYMDRKGRMPGDGTNKNGIIGDVAGEKLVATSAVTELAAATFTNPPANPVTVGSLSFYVYFGNDGLATPRNVMVICKTATCAVATKFTEDELKFIESFDASFDGDSDAGIGKVRGASAVTLAPDATADGAVVAVTVADTTHAGATAAWAIATHNAAVYWYDSPL